MKIKTLCLLISILILIWCIISKSLSVLFSLGSKSSYVDECLFFIDTIVPDVVSLIAYIVLLWNCFKLINRRTGK